MTAGDKPASDESVITQIQPVLLGTAPRVLLVEVATASDGEAALVSLAARFAPIVILDREMPDIADDCLYHSKNGGRDRVTVDTPVP